MKIFEESSKEYKTPPPAATPPPPLTQGRLEFSVASLWEALNKVPFAGGPKKSPPCGEMRSISAGLSARPHF